MFLKSLNNIPATHKTRQQEQMLREWALSTLAISWRRQCHRYSNQNHYSTEAMPQQREIKQLFRSGTCSWLYTLLFDAIFEVMFTYFTLIIGICKLVGRFASVSKPRPSIFLAPQNIMP